jgi:XTP/dITP diphosphohydrolase
MSEVKFVLASNNKGKLREMREILGEAGVSVLSQSEAGIQVEPEETGTTFEENALIKARAACSAAGIPAIADDSGLAVDALGGAPGIYSARYGNCATDEERVELLLENMRGKEQRSARFVSCIAAVFPNGDELITCGECEGEITQSPAGENGFGYDPVFYMACFGRTLAEVSAEEKNGVSHRGKALRAMKTKLDEYFKENKPC